MFIYVDVVFFFFFFLFVIYLFMNWFCFFFLWFSCLLYCFVIILFVGYLLWLLDSFDYFSKCSAGWLDLFSCRTRATELTFSTSNFNWFPGVKICGCVCSNVVKIQIFRCLICFWPTQLWWYPQRKECNLCNGWSDDFVWVV